MEDGSGEEKPWETTRAGSSISRKCLLTGHADGKTRARKLLR